MQRLGRAARRWGFRQVGLKKRAYYATMKEF